MGATGVAGRAEPAVRRAVPPPARRSARRPWLPTAVLLVGAAYCLVPVIWVLVAATKSTGDLFATFTFAPGTSLLDNLRELSAYRDGQFWRWLGNSAIYAGLGAALSALLSGFTGYTLAKYRFRGRELMFGVLIAGVLLPQVVLAVPQYLLLSEVGIAGTYWSVLLPVIIHPYGIYLARIYAAAAVPDELIEAARLDKAGELRIFWRVGLPLMAPGIVTVLLIQFVSIWNNFILPYIMLSDDNMFPLTLGLYTLFNQGVDRIALYSLVITGCVVSILVLIVLFLFLQRYWRLDLVSGAVKR
jgi:multiple sugar transport system permease protein